MIDMNRKLNKEEKTGNDEKMKNEFDVMKTAANTVRKAIKC